MSANKKGYSSFFVGRHFSNVQENEVIITTTITWAHISTASAMIVDRALKLPSIGRAPFFPAQTLFWFAIYPTKIREEAAKKELHEGALSKEMINCSISDRDCRSK